MILSELYIKDKLIHKYTMHNLYAIFAKLIDIYK